MSLKAQAITGAVSTGGSQLLKLGIKTIALAVLARYLGPEQFGLYALAMGITGILRLFQDAGLSTAAVQAPRLSQPQSSSMYWLNVGLGTAVFLVTGACGPVAARIFDRPELVLLFPCFGAVALISSFSAQRVALLHRQMKFRLHAAADVTGEFTASLVAVGLAMAGFGLWSLVALEIARRLMTNLVLALYDPWRPDFRFAYQDVRPFLRFGSAIMASNAVARFTQALDAIIITAFLGAPALGFFNRAQNILNGPIRQLLSPMAGVARAAVFRTAGQPDRFQRGVTSILGLIALGSALIVLTSLSFAQLIILLLLGRDWMACLPVFMALVPFAFVESSSVFLNSVLVSKGDSAALLKWKLANAVIVCVSLLAGLPWGIVGVALSYSCVGLLVRFPLLFLYTSRRSGLPLGPLLGSVLPTLAACTAAASIAVARNLHDPNLGIVGSLLTFVVVLVVFGGLTVVSASGRDSIRFVLTSIRERLRFAPLAPVVAARPPPTE